MFHYVLIKTSLGPKFTLLGSDTGTLLGLTSAEVEVIVPDGLGRAEATKNFDSCE